MLPNNNQLHISDLKSDSAKKTTQHQQYQQQSNNTKTTTTQTNNSKAPVPPKPNFTYNDSPKMYTPNKSIGVKQQQQQQGLGSVILEEVITDDDDDDNNNFDQYYDEDEDIESPLTPSKTSKMNSKSPRTPRRWRLVPANCTCAVHNPGSSQQTSVFCARCNSVTSQHNINYNKNPQSAGGFEGYSNEFIGGGVTGNNTYSESQSTTTKINFDNPNQYHSFYKNNYDVVSSGNTDVELQLLKTEVKHLEDQMSLNNLGTGGIKPPIVTNSTRLYRSHGPAINTGINSRSSNSGLSQSFHPHQPQQQYYPINIPTPQPRPLQRPQSSQPPPLNFQNPQQSQQPESINNTVQKLREEIQRLGNVIVDKNGQINIRDEELNEIKNQYQNSVVDPQSVIDLQTEVVNIKSDIDDKLYSSNQKDNNRLTSYLEGIRRDISNQERIQDLVSDITYIRNQISGLERISDNKSNKLNQDIMKLKSQLEIKDDKLNDLIEQTNQLNTTNKHLKNNIEIRDNRIVVVESERDELFNIKVSQDNKIQQLAYEIKDNKDKYIREINNLTVLVQEVQNHLNNLEKENFDMKERLSKVHFIIQDSPRRILSADEIQALTPIKRNLQHQQSLTPNHKYNSHNNSPYSINSDLKILNPNQATPQQNYQPKSSPPLETLPRTNSPSFTKPKYNGLEFNSFMSHNVEEENEEEEEALDISYRNENHKAGNTITSEQFNISQNEQNQEIDDDSSLEIEYNSPNSSQNNHNPVNIKDDSYDNRIEEEELDQSDHNNQLNFSINKGNTPKSTFSTPSGIQENFETPNGKSSSFLNQFSEENEDDDGWLSPNNKNLLTKLSNSRVEANKPIVNPPIVELLNNLPLLSSEEAKRNVSPQDCLLSEQFQPTSIFESTFYKFIQKSKIKNLLPNNFSRLGNSPNDNTRNEFKFDKYKLLIVDVNKKPSVCVGSLIEPFENFVENFTNLLNHKK